LTSFCSLKSITFSSRLVFPSACRAFLAFHCSPSWNAGWGEGGYIRIFRATGGAAEQCGTDSTPSDGDGCPDGPSSINVCGECAVLSDSSYPYGGRLV
jgi:hypothetical protein